MNSPDTRRPFPGRRQCPLRYRWQSSALSWAVWSLGHSDSIGAYEQGVSILRTLHQQLAAVEERVRMLVRIDDQGRPILEATAEPTSGADPAADAAVRKTARPGAKSVRAKRLPGMDDASGDVYDSTS